MRRDARRLVDHHDLVVVMDDAEVGDGDRHDLRLAPSLPGHHEPAAGCELVGLAERAPVQLDAAGLGDLGREGAGEPEELGEGGVHADAVEAVRDGETARIHGRRPRT